MRSGHLRLGKYGAFTLLVLVILGLTGAEVVQSAPEDWVIGPPRFVVGPGPHGNAESALFESVLATNIPLWSSSFTFNATPYPFTMVGTDPALGSHTSRIPTIIIPIRFVFSDSTTLDASKPACGDTLSVAKRTKNSPIFQKATYFPGANNAGPTNVGKTQYVDAYQRANFWDSVSTVSPRYHVLLSPVATKPSQVVFPAGSGVTVAVPGCALAGLVDINFFDGVIQGLIGELGIPKTKLPIFLAYNTFLFDGVPSNCCILGYHNANNNNQTYIFSSYPEPGLFGPGVEDIYTLSHEVGEWMDDPLVNNQTPPWGHVGQVPGCQDNLENGDPVSDNHFFTVTTKGKLYHPEDLVFFSWFARESPSRAVNGLYTFLNTFASPQGICQ